jgi:5-methylcytosine-specific restriction endonuclease McrA
MTAAEKYAEMDASAQERPRCRCHAAEMFWARDETRVAGGRWRCAVRQRETVARAYVPHPRKRMPEEERLKRARAAARSYHARNRDEGRKRVAAWRAANPERATEHNRRRRARKRGATVEDFTVADVIERDGYVCGLCSDLICPDLRWPHPLSLSVDHVVPLSRGGAHSLANTQPAHLRCNLEKWANE